MSQRIENAARPAEQDVETLEGAERCGATRQTTGRARLVHDLGLETLAQLARRVVLGNDDERPVRPEDDRQAQTECCCNCQHGYSDLTHATSVTCSNMSTGSCTPNDCNRSVQRGRIPVARNRPHTLPSRRMPVRSNTKMSWV